MLFIRGCSRVSMQEVRGRDGKTMKGGPDLKLWKVDLFGQRGLFWPVRGGNL